MSTCQISIITPVWNGLNYLEQCVNSVLMQEFTNWEMIISDNGSTDGTREYLDTIQDPRIKIFKQEKNLGIFGNLNFLVENTSAPIVQVLCHDDYLLPNGLQTVLQSWTNASEQTTFIRHNWPVYDPGKASGAYSSKVLGQFQKAENTDFVFFVFGNPAGNLSNMSFNPAYFFKGVRFSEALPYAGDYEYWGRLGNLGEWQLSNKEVSYIRRHSSQASAYLNYKGELITQQSEIKTAFYESIKNKYSKTLLRFRGSINYFRFIIQALHANNKLNYSTMFNNLRSPDKLHPLLTILLFIVTLGGKLFPELSAKLLVNKNSAITKK